MDLFSRTTAVLLTGALLLVAACEEPTATGEAAVVSLDHKGKPHGGGGGGGGNKPPDPVQKRVTIPANLLTGAVNMILPDTIVGAFEPYDGGECGVKARLDVDTDFFEFRPLDNGLGKKGERDAKAACGDDFPRAAWFNLAAATVHIEHPTDPTNHTLDVTLDEYIEADSVDALAPGDDNLGTARISNLMAVEEGSPEFRGNGFNLRYCLDDGSGRPFRFNSEAHPGSNDLKVTNVGGVFQVRTQEAPFNVGSCEHTRSLDGTVIELLLHMDLAYDIAPLL